MSKGLYFDKGREQRGESGGTWNWRLPIKWLLYVFFALAGCLLQTTLLTGLRAWIGVVPGLSLAVLVSVALYEGLEAASIFGLCIGFLIDCAGASGISLTPLVYVLVVLLCSFLSDLFINKNFSVWILMSITAYAAEALVNLLSIIVVWRNFHFLSALADVVLPNFLISVFLSVVVYLPSRAAARLTASRKKTGLIVRKRNG